MPVLKRADILSLTMWEPEPFDLPPVEPLPESRWLNDKHPDEERDR